jgi:hypothetical protein
MTENVRGLGAPPERYLAAAELVTARLIVEYPDLLDRYGDRGRAFGVHDTAYQLAWIVAAVELGSAARLRRDMVWLRDLLKARDFPMDVFHRNFELAVEACAEAGFAGRDELRLIDPVTAELVQ